MRTFKLHGPGGIREFASLGEAVDVFLAMPPADRRHVFLFEWIGAERVEIHLADGVPASPAACEIVNPFLP